MKIDRAGGFIEKYQKHIIFLIIFVAISAPYIFKNQIFDAENKYKNINEINVEESASTENALEENIYPDIDDIENISDKNLYKVVNVVDGDTIDVEINLKKERIRMIGVNTPETVDPRKTAECFGKEASNKTKELLNHKMVYLESDTRQGDRDKYGRLLRYVFLNDGINYNFWLIINGYAYEYTYNMPYKYQDEFKNAQKEAQESAVGLWASGVCDNHNEINSECNIKGNISSNGTKIYHIPGQEYYHKTVIDEVRGDKWFCSEEDAQEEGWRKAKV